MGRQARRGLIALSALGILAAIPSAAAGKTGNEQMDGGLVKARDKVVGTVIAARGVLNGVGRIVERPNRPGDSDTR
jgi:hypothetical protein